MYFGSLIIDYFLRVLGATYAKDDEKPDDKQGTSRAIKRKNRLSGTGQTVLLGRVIAVSQAGSSALRLSRRGVRIAIITTVNVFMPRIIA
jgi:hypothetical protein